MALVLDGNNLLTSGVINSMTAQNASGTYVDFTGIPVGVKRITVIFNGVSTSGSSIGLIQIGSGSVTTSGYTSSGWTVYANYATSSAGFLLAGTWAGNQTFYGSATLRTIGSNIWVGDINIGSQNQGWNSLGAGTVTLSGALDRVRITTSNGSDTFDAGTISVMYE